MADGDRPGGSGRGEAPRRARLRLFRGGGVRRQRLTGMPGDVAQRLSLLERRVEEALAGGDVLGRDLLRAGVDGALAVVASVQRRTLAETLDMLRLLARRELLGEPGDHVAPLAEALLRLAYRWWWRVETVGLDRVPADGRVVLVANRSGAPLPYEGFMIARALAASPLPRRGVRLVVDDWLARLPLVAGVLAQVGGVRGTPGTARRLLERDETLIVLPEGEQAMAKPYRLRYRLGSFRRAGFVRAAIQTGAPIVPVAVIGAEEAHPVFARLETPASLFGLPPLPLTPTFPWLGAAGLVPLPSKWTLHFGEPLEVAARHAVEDAERPAAVRQLRDQVRERLQALVLEGLRRRRYIFLAS
jgi:1-acyl-sn-glycerol-3-phosphate acyltransferase